MPRVHSRFGVAFVTIALAVASIVVVTNPARAAEFTESHTATIGLTPTNWSIDAVLPQFDPAKGDLIDVTVSATTEIDAVLRAENLSTSSTCNATLTWGADITVETSTGPLEVMPVDSQVMLLGVYDGVTDFAGTSGVSLTSLSAADAGTLTITDPAEMAAFQGLGLVTLPVAADGQTDVTGCGNIAFLTSTLASAEVVVTYRYVSSPGIDIEKATNGEDADTPTGPVIPVGDPVEWTYVVTNTGNVDLSNVSVVDDQGVAVTCPQDTLAVGETMTCVATGIAQEGQYANLGTTEGTAPDGAIVTDEDPSHYIGELPPDDEPAIDIEKATNGEDADTPTGPWIVEGDPVEWTYVVTNTGNVDLSNVSVVDDQGVAVTCPQDTLAVGETMTCVATGIAQEGQYANLGTTEGTAPDGTIVTDEDPSHYYGANRTCANGCSRGYWANPLHLDKWTGYSTSQSFASVFGVNVTGTLLDVIRSTGRGQDAVAREAVVALLNASHPDVPYPYTETEIITAIRTAFATGDLSSAQYVLGQINARTCPLGPEYSG